MLGSPTRPSARYFGSEQAVAMLPGRLRRAEHPAKALAEQAADGVRRFRQADGLLVVEDLDSPALTMAIVKSASSANVVRS